MDHKWPNSFHEQVKTDYLCGGNSSKNSISFQIQLSRNETKTEEQLNDKDNSVANLVTTAESGRRDTYTDPIGDGIQNRITAFLR